MPGNENRPHCFKDFLNIKLVFTTPSQKKRAGADIKHTRRGRRYGDICIHIADSLCYKAESNTPL